MSNEEFDIEVGYWSIRGLAGPCRNMVMHAGLKLNAKCYDLAAKPEGGWDGSSWMADAKPALKAKNPLMNLPYLVEGDMVVSQTNSVMAYLGRRTKLWGETEAEVSQCEQVRLLLLLLLFFASFSSFCSGKPLFALTPTRLPAALRGDGRQERNGWTRLQVRAGCFWLLPLDHACCGLCSSSLSAAP